MKSIPAVPISSFSYQFNIFSKSCLILIGLCSMVFGDFAEEDKFSDLVTDISFCNNKRYEFCTKVQTTILYEIDRKIAQKYHDNLVNLLEESVLFSGNTAHDFYNAGDNFWEDKFEEKWIGP